MPALRSPAGSPRPINVERYDTAGPSSARGGFTGANWTSMPSLQFEDAVEETVVTHITRTTTSFRPLQLPPIPMPEAIKLPYHLSKELYPLAHEATPDDMKWFPLKMGEQRVVISEDGPVESLPTPSATTDNPGWRRTLPIPLSQGNRGGKMTLVDALNGTRGKEPRKRSHQMFAPPERSIAATSQLTPSGSIDDLPSSVYPSPPRKRIRRPEDTRTPIPVETSGAPLSPLPSPELQTPPPLSSPSTMSLGPGHELAALYSLPSMLNHFDGLPDKLQQHVLMHMLRRSRMPTIQRIATFTTSAIKRDIISSLPRELAVQVLKCVDAKTLATSTRVCKKWKHLIDSERSVWKHRLIEDELYCGKGVEEEEEAVLEKRFKILDERARYKERIRKSDADYNREPYIAPPEMERSTLLKHVYRRRQQTQDGWFNKRPTHNSFPGHGTNVITCLQFDREKVISASDDRCINVYNIATGQIRKRLEGHEGGVWALQYRGNTLVTGSTDRSVRVWDLATMRLTHTFTGHTSTVRCLTIVEPVLDEKSGKYYPPYPLIVTGSRDASLRVWKLPKRGEPPIVKWAINTKGERVCIPLSPEENPYHHFALTGHTDAIRALACHGRYCISGSYDTTVRVWDIVKGKCLHTLSGHEEKVYSIVYDKYRHRCASGSMDTTVKIWDLKTGTCLHTLTGHTSLVGLLGLSPNHLVSAAADSSLRVWDADDLSIRHVLRNNGGAITCFRHDEDKVISGSDGMLKLWDIRRGKYVRDLVIGISAVWQVGIQGNLLVCASNRGGTTVFDVFDFGKLDHSSGVDNEALDDTMWENQFPRDSIEVEMRKRGHLRDYELDPDILRREQEERDAAAEEMMDYSDEEEDEDEDDPDGGFHQATIIPKLRPIVIDCRPRYTRQKGSRRSNRIARKSSEIAVLPTTSTTPKGAPAHRSLLDKDSYRNFVDGAINKLVPGRGVKALVATSKASTSRAAAGPSTTTTAVAGPSTSRAFVQIVPTKIRAPPISSPDPADMTDAKKEVRKKESATFEGKGKGKAKMPRGNPHANDNAGFNGSPSKPGPSRPRPINTRITRSRSGPGSSSPAKVARTSSAGQLSSVCSRKRTFLPVFDDDDDDDEVEEELEDAPRIRTRVLEKDDDDSSEDELDSLEKEEGDAVSVSEDSEEESSEEDDEEEDGDEEEDEDMSEDIDP